MKAIVDPRSKASLFKVISLIFAVICTSAFCASAESHVDGLITEDTTWFLAGSPYIVTGDVTVRESVFDSGNVPTLTIESGVEVRFEPGTGLYIGDDTAPGILVAQGEPGSLITFTSNAASPSPGDWKGIVINESAKWGENLCTNGSCEASDVYGAHDCSHAFCGDPGYYHSTNTQDIHWLGYDFGPGVAHKIDRIKIYQYRDGNYDVEGSNDPTTDWNEKSWTTLVSVAEGKGEWQTIDFENDTAYRFIRVKATSEYTTTHWFCVWELEMYASSEIFTTLEHSMVEYGGNTHNANIHIESATPRITNSSIRHSSGYGIYSLDAASSPVITNNNITDNGSYPVRIRSMMSLDGNAYSGNGIQAVEVYAANIVQDTVWKNEGIPFVITEDIKVSQSIPDQLTTLSIEPGVEIRFEPGTGLYIGDDNTSGALVTLGTESEPVTFTSNAASPSPGDWKGIVINESAKWGENLCTNGSCMASDVYGAHDCSHAFGGDPGYYHSTNTQDIHWLGYDFGPGVAHKIDRIKIDQYRDGNYDVEGSNDPTTDWNEKSWTTLVSVTEGKGDWQTIDFENDTAYRFIRVKATSEYTTIHWFCVWELEMYASSGIFTTLGHSMVEYGGRTHNANIHIESASPRITNNSIRHSNGYGIYSLDAVSSPVITNNNISDNGSYPVRIRSMMSLDGNAYSGNGIQAVEVYAANIIQDTVWKNEGIPFVITEDITVSQSIPDQLTTLSIEPGVEIRFEPGTGLYIGNDNALGALVTLGTESEPVIFTSNTASPAPGDWKGIVINESAKWGENLCTNGSCEASDVYGNNDCSQAFGGNPGYYHSTNTQDTHWLGYDFGPGTAHKVNQIKINQYEAGYNTQLYVIEGSNSTEPVWEDKTWTVLADVVDGKGGWQTVTFQNDTAYQFVRVKSTGGYTTGNWLCIWELEMYAGDASPTTLSHALVEYGGNEHNSNLYLISANPTIFHNTIRNSSHSGVYVSEPESHDLTISCNTLKGNLYGIYLSNNASPLIYNNNFISNQNFGIYNAGSKTIIASDNWWNDPGGPGQSGDSVYGNVDFSPWLNTLSDCAVKPVYPPHIDPFMTPTNNSTPILSGTKDAFAAILLNGQVVVGHTPETFWECTVILQTGMNELIFKAKGQSGQISENVLINIFLDETPPDLVENLSVINEGSGTSLQLNWFGYDESGQGDIAKYIIYIDSSPFTDVSSLTPLATVDSGTFQYTIENLTEGETYYFIVIAEDTAGNSHTSFTAPFSAFPSDYQALWDNKLSFSINTQRIDEPLYDFPILLHLSENCGLNGYDASSVFNELSDDADQKKIAVFTENGQSCFVEIERWDSANKEAWIWVKLPYISHSEGTELTFCYDKDHSDNSPSVGNTGDPAAQNVWGNHYLAVWHMAQEPNGDAPQAIIDSTINENHATSHGSMTVSDRVKGKMGDALEFDNTNTQYLSLSSIHPVAWTAEVTAYPMNNTVHTDGFVVFDGNGIVQAGGYWCVLGGNDVQAKGDGLLLDSEYVAIAATYDGSETYRIFTDGIPNAYDNYGSTNWWLDNLFYISRGNRGNFAEGIIDEVRISDIDRSDAWIKATYYSNHDKLVHFGSYNDPPVSVSNFLSINVEGDGTKVFLDWSGYDESLSGDIVSYRIYVEGSPFSDVTALTPFDTVEAGTFTYTVENLTEGVPYYFVVIPVDSFGNFQTADVSALSGTPVHYESIWSNRLSLFIHPARIDEALADFPIMLHLSDSCGMGDFDATNIFAELSTDSLRKKIGVFTADGTPCYIEIEKWDSIEKDAWLWVKIPQINSNQGTVLTFCFDSAHSDNTAFVGDTGELPAENVWDTGFVSVWHMSQDPNGDVEGSIKDSTRHGNHLSPHGNMTTDDVVAGRIGTAIEFDGIDDALFRSNLKNGPYGSITGTFEYIFKSDIYRENSQHIYYGSRIPYQGFFLGTYETLGTDKLVWSMRGNISSVPFLVSDSNPFDGTWKNVAVSLNGFNAGLYLDGIEEAAIAYSPTGVTRTRIEVNNAIGQDEFFQGITDEIRISNTERSSAWLKATKHSNYDDLIIVGSDHDNLPPHAVTDLTVSGESNPTTVILDWSHYNESIDGDIVSYRIYAETDSFEDVAGLTPVGTVDAGTFTFTVEGLAEDTNYYYAVVAVDHDGNALNQVTSIQRYQGPDISNLQVDGIELENGFELKNSALITLNASDQSGIDRLEFYVDGTHVHTDVDGTSGYYFFLDILSLQDGDHNLRIESHDSLGNIHAEVYTFKTLFNSPIIIGSRQMSVGEQQTLSIMNHRAGQIYTWRITSGGGSLSDDSGYSVTYTAPDSNPGCNNPIIVVEGTGGTDSIEIGVNEDFTGALAYAEVGDWTSPLKCNGEPSMCGPSECVAHCLEINYYACDGSFVSTEKGECREACDPNNRNFCLPGVWERYSYDFAPIENCFGNENPFECTGCIVDLRDDVMKDAGCCYGEPPPECPGPDGCPESDCDCKTGEVANPINVFVGSNFEKETDVRLPSSLGDHFIFQRSYNSRLHRRSPLGYGWTHNFYATLDPDFIYKGKIYLQIIDESGVGIYFQYIGGGQYAGAFKEKSRVEKNGDAYIWNLLDGRRLGFSPDGLLMWLEDELGNRTELTYDSNARLQTITDTASSRTLALQYNGEDRIQTITGPITSTVSDGIWVTYGYDDYGNLTSVTYADGSGFDYSYDDPNDAHNLTEKKDKMGHLLSSWSYDDRDRAVENVTRDGMGASIEYATDTQVIVTDAYGVTRSYTIGNADGRKRVTDINGTQGCESCGNDVIRVEYDRALRVIEKEYTNGLIIQYDDYDSRGNAGIVITAVGTDEEKTTIYTYHPEMNVRLSLTEPSVLGQGDKITIWDYDSDGNDTPNENPTRLLHRKIDKGFTKDSSGAVVLYEYVTTYNYNGKGQVLSLDGPQPGAQDTITYAYDETTGDLLSITSPLTGTTTYSDYDAAGNKGRVTDPNGNVQVYTYDGKGRIKTITNQADSSTTTYEYNTAGDLIRVTGFNGVSNEFAYDTDYGRMIRTTDALGNYIRYAYDDQGNRIEKSLYKPNDERTYQMGFDYQHPDQPGKLWKEINPDNTYAEYDYDAGGNIQSITDANGNTTFYDYDDKNRLIRVTQPGNVETTYAYGDDDNLISVTDAENHTTGYTYDDAGRMISTFSPDTGTTTYAYDAAGNLISKTDANENTIIYAYDALNRLTDIHFPDSSQDITYTYDQGTNGKGRLTGMTDPSGDYTYTYDTFGNLIKEEKTVAGVTYDTEYAYDSAGVLTEITYPNGRTVDYHIDDAGRVIQVSTKKDGFATTVADNIGYLPFGPLNNLTYGNGTVLSQSFDLLYRPEGIVAGAFQNASYTVDSVGNITAIADNLDSEKSKAFQYDDLNRLIQATGVFGTIGYTYDKVGNRLLRTVDGDTDTYTYETGNNRLSEITGISPQSFSYDANGNATASGDKILTYNQNDRLIQVTEDGTVKGEYTYNGNGQRVKKTSGVETIIYHYDRFGNIIGESTADGTFIKEYIYLNSMRLAAFASEIDTDNITVTVATDDGRDLSGLKVYAFTETGSYTGKFAETDEFGKAEFAVSEFSEGNYKFRADYLGNQFWSEDITVPGTYKLDIEIEEETATLTVIQNGETQSDVKVYLFNDNGSYLGIYGITDENGEVFFDLPVGMRFKFRADTLGSQYFSDIIEIASGETNFLVIDMGGGFIKLTVDKGDSIPLTGVKAYLFHESGSYFGMWNQTDDQGIVCFDVSAGRYKIRVDYLGYQFWSDIIDTEILLTAVLSLPHHDVTITVAGDHDGDIQVRENINTYLFTPAGAYLGVQAATDEQGQTLLNLPEKDYMVRADYLSQQYWSEVFNASDETITIEEGTAAVTVTGTGNPIEGINIYVFNSNAAYLGLYDVSDEAGNARFRLPEGDYNFRADYMGNQYWSGVSTIIAHTDNPITVSTGGGSFTARILKAVEEPLVSVNCYLFSESGAYLGQYGTTNDSGEVSFGLSDGSYKIRVDCLGYEFWTDVFSIPGAMSITHVIPHHETIVSVVCDYNGDVRPGADLDAYLFTASGANLSQHQVTDAQGQAIFDLPEKDYKIRADYLTQQFWSNDFNSTDPTITIDEGMAEIEVLQGSSPLSNVKVYAFNSADAYLGWYETTDAGGKAFFRLPAATYKFRADHQGTQYWATETISAHQVNSITLSTGGGNFELTVEKESGVPMSDIKIYVFSPAGSYLGIYDQTDELGNVSFDLSDGSYMFRADYLGYQFWTDVYAIPETFSDIVTIPHQDVKVTVKQIYGDTIDPIENIKAYLFTESGSYMGVNETTNADGRVIFNLPQKDYKVRADYLGSQYWSDTIYWLDTDIDIDHGKINIHVTDLGVDVEGAKVYLFTVSGTYLGKYENTDALGMVSLTLPVKSYKFRVDYDGSQCWSDTVTPIAHDEQTVHLELDLLALQLTNNPNPDRFDGIPIEKKPDGIMLASIGSLTGILTHSIVAQTPEPKIYYYINDHLGTPMKVIDENNTVAWSADYKPFGEADTTVDTFKNNFRFPGQYYDKESQLHYNYHRYYQPNIGRYLRADPIGILKGKNHLFAYALNNSLNFFDPTGLSVFADCIYSSGGYYIGIGILECDLTESLCINGVRERAKYFAILGGITIGSPVGITYFILEFKKSDDVRALAGPTTIAQSSSAVGVGASFGQICLGNDCASGWTGQKGIDLSVDIFGGYGRVTDPVDESCCEN